MKKIFLPLFCCIALQVSAQQEIKGTLQYNNQSPVALADVVILNDEKVIDETSTDENGNFTTTLENGTYTIRVEEAGTLLYTQKIVVENNQNIGLIIVPKTENVTLKEAVVTGQK